MTKAEKPSKHKTLIHTILGDQSRVNLKAWSKVNLGDRSRLNLESR